MLSSKMKLKKKIILIYQMKNTQSIVLYLNNKTKKYKKKNIAQNYKEMKHLICHHYEYEIAVNQHYLISFNSNKTNM